MDFSLVIPFFNEERNVKPVIDGYNSVLEKESWDYEIIAVDNNSEDKTGEKIKEFENNPKIKYLFVEQHGYGNAVNQGLKYSRGKWIGWIDGDQQISPEDFLFVIKKTIENNADFCKGERTIRHDGFLRSIITIMYRILIFLLLKKKIYDVNGKPKFFKKEIFGEIQLKSKGWFIDAEIIDKFLKMGYNITDVPIIFHDRKEGKTSINIKSIIKLSREISEFVFGK